MNYNQVQSFQINDYVNPYVDIGIVGFKTLYSKSIAQAGWAQTLKLLDIERCTAKLL